MATQFVVISQVASGKCPWEIEVLENPGKTEVFHDPVFVSPCISSRLRLLGARRFRKGFVAMDLQQLLTSIC
jgi:hypothetical protein